MGGRIASLVDDEAKVAGFVCLGYLFHPTAEPYKRGPCDFSAAGMTR